MAAWTRFCLLLCFVGFVRSDVLCEAGFCSAYQNDVGCGTPAQECSINNATHTGLWMLSPTICNCCEFCLPFYGVGQPCSLGGPGTGFTVGRCGHGLTCLPSPDGEHKCGRMQSECHSAQDQFDDRQAKGEVGAMETRPLCDGKGKYATSYCVPAQTCFCQSEDGERIFGEVPNMGTITLRNMHCACSRLHEKIMKSISPGVPHPVIGPRCTSDGNFNPIQCVNRNCFCVDRITGVVSGDNRIDLDEEPITKLDCYDASLDLFPQESLGSPPYNYTTPCFEDMKEKIEMIQEKEKEGYIVDYFNGFQDCKPDGTYGRVMKRQSGLKLCVDDRNQQIEDYSAEPNTDEYDSMDCKCALTSLIMVSSAEKPVCCKNGNYRKIQCHRGVCRCVDSDGRQTSERENADVTKLSCYTQNWRTC